MVSVPGSEILFDLLDHDEKIRNFFSVLAKTLRENDIFVENYSGTDLEFQFDSNNHPVAVVFHSSGGQVSVKKNIAELLGFAKQVEEAENFINQNTLLDVPLKKMFGVGITGGLDLESAVNMPKFGWGKMSLEDIMNKTEGKPGDNKEKTYSEILEENKVVYSEGFKKNLQESLENSSINVGGINLLEFSKVKTAKEAYGVVFDNTDVGNLINEAIYCLNGVAFELSRLQVPVFFFPDTLPTVDLMASFSLSLESALLEMIQSAILGLLESILELLLKYCKELREGLSNFNNLNIDNEKYFQRIFDLLKDENFLNSLGLTGNLEEDLKRLVKFILDVLYVLTPQEILDLFLGHPSEGTLYDILAVAGSGEYGLSESFLSSSFRMRALFFAVGNVVDKERIQNLANACRAVKTSTGPDGESVCTQQESALRDTLEREGADSEEIQRQIASERDRKKRLLEELARKADKLKNLKIPEACSPSKKGKLPNGFDRMAKSTIGAVFDPVYIAFDKDVSDWYKAFVKEKTIERKITSTLKPEEFFGNAPLGRIDGRIQYLLTQGVKPSGDQYTFHEKKIFIAHEIKDALENLSSRIKIELNVNRNVLMTVEVPKDEEYSKMFEMFSSQRTPGILSLTGQNISDVTLQKQYDGTLPYKLNVLKQTTTKERKFNLRDVPRGTEDRRSREDNNAPSREDLLEEQFETINKVEKQEISYVEGQIALRDSTREYLSSFESVITFSTRPQIEIFKKILGSFNTFRTSRSSDALITDYVQMSNKFVSALASRVSDTDKNKLFKTISVRTSGDTSLEIPVLKSVKFTFPPEGCSGERKHLLDIEELKAKALEDFSNNLCLKEFSNSSGQGRPQNSLEKSISDSVVQTTIRLYVLDYYLRGCFVLNEFSLDPPNEMLLDFFAEKIKTELFTYGEKYANDLLDSAKELFYRNGLSTDYSGDAKELKKLIEQQVVSLSKILRNEVFGSKRSKDIYDFTLQECIPAVNVFSSLEQRWEDERTITGQVPIISLETEVATSEDARNNIVVFNGFVFEKYIRLAKKSLTERERNNLPSGENPSSLPAGIFSPQEVRGLFNGILLSRKMKDYYEKISYGLRLCYAGEVSGEEYQNLYQTAGIVQEKLFGLGSGEPSFLNPLANTEIIDEELLSMDFNVAKTTDFASRYGDRTLELYQKIKEVGECSSLFDYVFPMGRYLSLLAIQSVFASEITNNNAVSYVFSTTKDRLRFLFETVNNGGMFANDSYEEDRALKALGGKEALGEVLRKPLEQISGADIQKMFNSKGFDYGIVLKFMLEAPVQIFRGFVEFADPNINIASKMAMFTRIFAWQDIPVSVFSLMLQPSTLMPGSWMGPPLTFLGIAYLLLSMGFSINIPEFEALVKRELGNSANTASGVVDNPLKCEE